MKDDDYTTTNYTNELNRYFRRYNYYITMLEAKDLQDSVSVSFSKKYNKR